MPPCAIPPARSIGRQSSRRSPRRVGEVREKHLARVARHPAHAAVRREHVVDKGDVAVVHAERNRVVPVGGADERDRLLVDRRAVGVLRVHRRAVARVDVLALLIVRAVVGVHAVEPSRLAGRRVRRRRGQNLGERDEAVLRHLRVGVADHNLPLRLEQVRREEELLPRIVVADLLGRPELLAVRDAAARLKALRDAERGERAVDGAHVGEDSLTADTRRWARQAEEGDPLRVHLGVRHVHVRFDRLLRRLIRRRAHALGDVGALRAAATQLERLPPQRRHELGHVVPAAQRHPAQQHRAV
mmetsp:Transcript_39414/g.103370  ORF Transcript_39414/g.103370 Transcript_39414/m.103370 type:complete len:301 (+) Transcript_39414:355-1257(+)